MNHIKRCAVAGQVKRFCNRFAQGAGAALGQVIPRQDLLRWVEEEAGDYRERIYSPLQTLSLFIEQVLGADQSCLDDHKHVGEADAEKPYRFVSLSQLVADFFADIEKGG